MSGCTCPVADFTHIHSPELCTQQPESVCQEAHRLVTEDRGQAYDHPARNLDRTARLWSVYLGQEITPRQVAICQVLVKVARDQFAPGHDHLVDIAGWAQCAEMAESNQEDKWPTF